MKNVIKLLGLAAFAAVIALTFFALSITGCLPEPDPDNKTPEDLPYAERWVNKTEPSSTAKLAFSVASDGVCTITVSGTAEPNVPGNEMRYKASVGYRYTAKANTNYAYEFEAWTQSGSRTINVQYFFDSASGDYGLREYFIDSQRKTYTYIGKGIPKGGEYELEFQCADQVGTFYVKVLSIKETNADPNTPEDLPASERWWKYADPSSTATIEHFSVDKDGVCKITIGGTAEPNNNDDGFRAWTAMAGYNYTSKTNTSYIYKFEAWTDAGARILHFQYYEDINEGVYRNEDIHITSERTTYTITGRAIPRGSGEDALRFQFADRLGTLYIKILSITAYETGTLAVSNFSVATGGWITGSAYSEDGEIQLSFEGLTFEPGKTGTIVFDVYQEVEGERTPFTGNVTIPIGQLYIDSWGGGGEAHYINTAAVTFTKGSAAINFVNQMRLDSVLQQVGTLTITGISIPSFSGEIWGGGDAYFESNNQIDKPDLRFYDLELNGSTATFGVWHIKYSNFNNPSTPENVNGTVPTGKLSTYIGPFGYRYTNTSPITFTNGSAEVNFSDIEEDLTGGPGGSGGENIWYPDPGDGKNNHGGE